MANRAGTSDLSFVDDTMSDIRRNWNVTTQDDVSFYSNFRNLLIFCQV